MGKRVDFTTTDERITWLKTTASREEISVSQLLNRLIRNRMKTEERFKPKTNTNDQPEKETKILTKEEILKQIEEAHQKEDEDDGELPF